MTTPEKKPFILVVDDDADAAFLVLRLLSKSEVPHEYLHLGDGEKAIQYLLSCTGAESAPPRPSAMLLDVKMPR